MQIAKQRGGNGDKIRQISKQWGKKTEINVKYKTDY